MASTRGRSHPSLIADIEHDPGGFDLFQAIRLAERIVARQRRSAGRPLPSAAGRGVDPAHASVRIRSATQLSYAGSEIASVRLSPDRPAEIVQTVVGLVGATGTMPHAFSELVHANVRVRNTGLRAFLDLFNDRLAGLLYEAFAKYRIEIERERAPLTGRTPIDDTIRALTGVGSASLRDRLATPDCAVLHHTGLLSRHARSAHAVERTLSSALGQTVSVEQFVGEWLPIDRQEQSRLASGRNAAGSFCRLGGDAVVGARVWSVEGRVRLDIGPMDYRTFAGFLPGGVRNVRLRDLAAFTLGADTAFGLRLRLPANAVPPMRIGGDRNASTAGRLGWNTWLGSDGPRTRPGIVELPATSGLALHSRT